MIEAPKSSKRKSRKKIIRGAVIETIKQLDAVMSRQQWIYFGDRAYHPGWVQSWHYGLVRSYLRQRRLHAAFDLATDRPYVSVMS